MRASGTHVTLTISGVLTVMAASGVVLALDEVPVYHVTRMAPMLEEIFPGVQYPTSTSRGLNENGDLVGEAATGVGSTQAWVYTVEHGVTALPLPPGFVRSVPMDVSDRDANGEIMIVGGSDRDLWLSDATLWRFSTVTGEVLETRNIGILPGFDQCIAVGVNNGGTVVGFCEYVGPWSPLKYDVQVGVLEPFDFPTRPEALNNVGQVVGGRYRGDLNGNYVDLGIPPDCTSSVLLGINDLGWVSGRAGRPWTDGAGHFMASVTRFTEVGWHVLPALSPWDSGFDINTHGDLAAGIGPSWYAQLYIAALDEYRLVGTYLAPEFFFDVDPRYAYAINDAAQIAASYGGGLLLTPQGQMIIPGDVNGDVVVNLDDYCAWVADPIDLNGDGVIDPADEQWLIDRLGVFGFTVEDCNANGAGDHCDILDAISADCDENDIPDECQPDCSNDGVPDVCEADCNTNGQADPCDILDGSSLDCNANGVPDECDQGGVTNATNAFDPPINLEINDTVLDDMLVIDVGTIEDVDFTLDIRYRIGDLTVLLSHGDVTITILDRPGHPQDGPLGNGQFGYDIIVDDEGAGDYLENVGNFGSPFEHIESPPSYRPDEPLSTFDGMPSEGVWTVHIMTTESWSPADTFIEWGLIITRAADPAECDCSFANFANFFDCSNAPGIPVGDACACFDMDGDQDVDFADFGQFQLLFGG